MLLLVTTMVISMLLTAFVLVLTLITISKGYAFKHTIDPRNDEHVEDFNKKNK